MRAWLSRLIGDRSYKTAVKAMPYLERAQALRDINNAPDALAAAREGLEILRDPDINRGRAFESTLLISLTTVAEELAEQLHRPGASREDIRVVVAILRGWDGALERFPDLRRKEPASIQELRARLLPYLESRLAAHEGGSR